MTKWPRMNMAAGPVDVTERTLRDMAQSGHVPLRPGLQGVLRAHERCSSRSSARDYDVVIMQGEAILGLEAAAASLIRPGDKVLNLVSGVFGKWFQDFHREVRRRDDRGRRALQRRDRSRRRAEGAQRNPGVKFLSVVHSETPSGTHNPVKEIGAICKEFGVLTMVDTVSGLGGELLSPEEWNMDVAIAGPQKCLGGTPGLSLMTISPAAWQAMESAANPLRG